MKLFNSPKHFIILFSFFLISCSLSDKSKLTLGINDTYALTNNEKEVSTKNSNRVKFYNSLFNHYEKAQIPLHKSISSDDYNMFFGIPIGYNRTGYYYTFLNDTNFTVLRKNADEKKYYNKVLRKNDSLYVSTEIIENIFNASYYIVHVCSKDSLDINSMYEQNYAFSKLSFK